MGTNVSAPSFPTLAPLNLYPQCIIKPDLGGLNKNEGPPVLVLESLMHVHKLRMDRGVTLKRLYFQLVSKSTIYKWY